MNHNDDCPDPLCLNDLTNPSICETCPYKPIPHPHWGGRRPGAGAPLRNLNGFKHGKYSKLIESGIRKIAQDPELAAILYLLISLGETKALPPETRTLVQKALNSTNVLKIRGLK